MKRFYAHVWLAQVRMLEAIQFRSRSRPDDPLDHESTAKRIEIFTTEIRNCAESELAASGVTARKILTALSNQNTLFKEFGALAAEYQDRVIDEMSLPRFFELSVAEAYYYNNPFYGWEEIIERFPRSLTDIEESRKCFACARYPAAVFHSLQVIEIGLIELGKVLGVNDPISGWTAVSIKLQAIQRMKYTDRSLFQQEHSEFLEQVAGTVEGLKNAWRNKVSHAHGKLTLMTADFSAEIAEEILSATRAFMRRLATEGPLVEHE